MGEDDIKNLQKQFGRNGSVTEKIEDLKNQKFPKKMNKKATDPKKPEDPNKPKLKKRALNGTRTPLIKSAALKTKVRTPKRVKPVPKIADPIGKGKMKLNGLENALVLGPWRKDPKMRLQKLTLDSWLDHGKVAFPPKLGLPHVLESHDQIVKSCDKKAVTGVKNMAGVQASSTRPQIPTDNRQQQSGVLQLSQKRGREDDYEREREEKKGKVGRYEEIKVEKIEEGLNEDQDEIGVDLDEDEENVENEEDRECCAAIMQDNTIVERDTDQWKDQISKKIEPEGIGTCPRKDVIFI